MNLITHVKVKRMSALGDVILVTPFLRELKKYYKIHFASNHASVAPSLMDTTKWDFEPKGCFTVDLDLAYESRPHLHVLDAYSEVIRSLGLPVPNLNEVGPRVDPMEPEKWVTESLQYKKYAVMHLGGYGWPAKKIKPEFWNDLASTLIKYHGLKLVVVGTNMDKGLRKSFKPLDLRSKLTVGQTREIIARSSLFIGSDSAPFHIASCTDVPQVGLFTVINGNFVKPLHKKSLIINTELECGNCLRRLPAPRTTHYCVKEIPNVCTSSFDPSIVYQKILQNPETSNALKSL